MRYTFDALQPSDPYYADWADLRRRRRIAWAADILFPVASVLVHWPLHAAFGWHWPWTALPVLFGVGLANLYRQSWPCPRCGHTYFRTCGFSWPFANRCLHCGLPR